MELAELGYIAVGMLLGWTLGFGMSFLIFVMGKDDKPDNGESYHVDRQ